MTKAGTKEIITQQVDANGEIISTEKVKEIFRDPTAINFILINITYGLPYIIKMIGNELAILVLMAYHINKHNNCLYLSSELKNDIGEFLGILDARTMNKRIKHLESVEALCAVGYGKYIINPDVIIIGSSKNYEVHKQLFDEAMAARLKWGDKKKSKLASFGLEHEKHLKGLKNG